MNMSRTVVTNPPVTYMLLKPINYGVISVQRVTWVPKCNFVEKNSSFIGYIFRSKHVTLQSICLNIINRLGVVPTLMNHCQNIIKDQTKEEDTMKKALFICGYPELTFQKVKQQEMKKDQIRFFILSPQ